MWPVKSPVNIYAKIGNKADYLSSRPVDTCHRYVSTDTSGIDDKVSDLSIENQCRGIVTHDASILVFISIYYPTGGEVRAGLDYGKTIWVANDLGVVIIYYRLGNDVCAGREVDGSRSGSRSGTFAWLTTIAAAYGKIL